MLDVALPAFLVPLRYSNIRVRQRACKGTVDAQVHEHGLALLPRQTLMRDRPPQLLAQHRRAVGVRNLVGAEDEVLRVRRRRARQCANSDIRNISRIHEGDLAVSSSGRDLVPRLDGLAVDGLLAQILHEPGRAQGRPSDLARIAELTQVRVHLAGEDPTFLDRRCREHDKALDASSNGIVDKVVHRHRGVRGHTGGDHVYGTYRRHGEGLGPRGFVKPVESHGGG